MADIFISYSSQDKTAVSLIAKMLEARGWSVWWDRNIPPGKSYAEVIENELEQSQCVLVIWTKRSIQSEWVKNEASEALRRKIMVPLLLEEVNVPLAFRHVEAAMLINWDGQQDHQELEPLWDAISKMITQGKLPLPKPKPVKQFPTLYLAVLVIGGMLSFVALNFYLNFIKTPDLAGFQGKFYLTAIALGIALSAILFGFINAYSAIREKRVNKKFKLIIPAAGIIGISLGIIFLPKPSVIHIHGKVVTASEIPIKDAQISVDGTKYYAKSLTNGSFHLMLENFSVGEQISVIVTHDNFEDKELHIKLIAYKIENIQFTLNPFSP